MTGSAAAEAAHTATAQPRALLLTNLGSGGGVGWQLVGWQVGWGGVGLVLVLVIRAVAVIGGGGTNE